MQPAAPLVAERATPAERGTFAPLVELLLVGGATLVLLPLGWLLRRAIGLDDAEYAVGFATFYAAYVVNDPHFAVTYLLFYKDARRRAVDPSIPRAQRARYVMAGAIVPAALVVWAIASLAIRSAQGIGAIVQLMYLLVGWHYVKQGFGVFAVLSARRGIAVAARERRVLLAHAFAGWAYAWASPAMAAGEFEERGVVYRAFARPRLLELLTGGAFALTAAAVVWMLVAKWRKERRTFPLAPLVGLLVSVWLWTIYSAADPLLRYAIPALHSIQYAYFVWLSKRNEARAEEGPPFFGRPAGVRLATLAVTAVGLGWLLFHGVPGVLDAALVTRGRHGAPLDALGATPFAATFYVVVNVHHFFMDNVIWRRENPDARWLRA